MSSKFCVKCGAKHTFTYAPPKFCSDCGHPMNAAVAVADAPPSRAPSPVSQLTKSQSDGEFTDASSVPHVEKLEVSIELDSNVMEFGFDEKNGFSFGKKRFEKRSTQF